MPSRRLVQPLTNPEVRNHLGRACGGAGVWLGRVALPRDRRCTFINVNKQRSERRIKTPDPLLAADRWKEELR